MIYDVHDSEHPSGTSRLSRDAFLARYGQSWHLEPETLLAQIEANHLHGRGGAHFSTARKIQSAIAAGGGGMVIANGAEGEPSAAKDAALWQTNPHLVLRGLRAVGTILGQVKLGIWVHEDSYATRRSIEAALHEENADGSESQPVAVYLSPHRYVAGEASAVISAVQGGAAVPRFTPSKSRAWGAGNAPVLVLNTETLAHIGLLESTKMAAYPDPERTLITVIEPARRTVHEVSSTTRFADVQEFAVAPAAVLLGGYGGEWVRWSDIQNLPVSQSTLHDHGLSLGAGIVGILPGDACGLRETAHITAWMAEQSAQQCGPCMFGLPWLAEDMAIIANAEGRFAPAMRRLRERLPMLVRRGACSHPDGVARLAESALAVFADELHHHKKRMCTATYRRPIFPTRQGIHA